MRLAFGMTLENGHDDRVTSEPVAAAAARLGAVTRLLPAEDRRLVDLLMVRGLSHRMAAAELRVSPGVISRRVRRLRNLIASPTVRAIADHIDSLAPAARTLAVEYFFARVAINVLCQRTGLARREVQTQLDFIRGWARALHRAAVVSDGEATDDA